MIRHTGKACITHCLLVLATGIFAQEGNAPLADSRNQSSAVATSTTNSGPALQWHEITHGGIEGRAYEGMKRDRLFDRLPSDARENVPEGVWLRSRESAGMIVRFRTDAGTIWVDYDLMKENLTNPNMTASGSSGIDLYARNDSGQWRWVGVTRPKAKKVRQPLISGAAPDMREYAAYLPLYNGIEHLSIGIPPGAVFEVIPPRREKPVVFYGTSITHGAAASRPGMTHAAILGRRLDCPIVNLGFGGVGRMDSAMAGWLAKIDAALYVIDCLPNMNAALIKERCLPFIRRLRALRPDTPIILVEDRRNTNSWIYPERNQHHTDNHATLRECYAVLQAEDNSGIYYIPGNDLLGDDGEGSTDGSHPSDLGFMRQADQFEPVLRAALGR